MSGQLWWLCPHLKTEPHRAPDGRYCPGGHPVEGGENVEVCIVHRSQRLEGTPFCGQGAFQDQRDWQALMAVAFALEENPNTSLDATGCQFVERFLIPLSNPEGEK